MSQYESKTGLNRITSDATKRGSDATKNVRHGVNNYLDNSIQPSAARAADRGASGHHKAPIDVAAETGHSSSGPAMGTGTAGFSTHDRPGQGTAGANTSTIGGGTGGDLSRQAKQVSSSLQKAVTGPEAKRMGAGLQNAVSGLTKK